MIRRIVVPLLLGVVVLVASQIAQLLVYLVTSALWPSTFPAMGMESDLGSQAWLNRLSVQFSGAALLLVLLCWWLARFAGPATVLDGLGLGVLWALVVAGGHLVVGLGNDTLGMFASPGMWVMVAAIVLGPVLHVWWRDRRPTSVSGQQQLPSVTPASSPARRSSGG